MKAKILISKVLPACYKGDLAIAESMLKTLSRTHADWELSILCRRPLEDDQLFSPYGNVYGELFPARSSLPGQVIFSRVVRYFAWLLLKFPSLDDRGKKYVSLCLESDILVFCGGGSPGGYGLTNLVIHALIPILIAKRIGKPVFLSGLSIELPKRRLEKWVTRFILQQVDLISVREELSLESVEKLGVKTKVIVTADWAFLLDNLSSELSSNLWKNLSIPDGKTLIGMNLRDEGSGDSDGRTRKGSDYRKTLTQAILKILEQTESIIVVVSMNLPADLRFAHLVCNELPPSLQDRVFILDESYEPQQIKAIISRMDIFIGTRLHPSIFALSSQIPVIAVHHLNKVRGLMKLFGLEKYFLEVNNLTPELLSKKTKELLTNKQRIREEIINRLPDVEKAVYQNVELIESLIKEVSE